MTSRTLRHLALAALVLAAAAGCATRPDTMRPGGMGMGMGPNMEMHRQMDMMQQMREKMAAARTDAERQALLAEHMQMMQSMMQMMMERMDAMPGRPAH